MKFSLVFDFSHLLFVRFKLGHMHLHMIMYMEAGHHPPPQFMTTVLLPLLMHFFMDIMPLFSLMARLRLTLVLSVSYK